MSSFASVDFHLWRVLPISMPLAAVGANLALFSNNHYAFWSSAAIVFPLTALGGMVAYRTMVSHGAMQDFGATPGRFLVGTNFVTLAVLLGCGLGCALVCCRLGCFRRSRCRPQRTQREESNQHHAVGGYRWRSDGVCDHMVIPADSTHGYKLKLSAIEI